MVHTGRQVDVDRLNFDYSYRPKILLSVYYPGGNANSINSSSPVQTYAEHVAAVKAIAWSPHHHGLLASGGGTADRCIRFWNTLTGQPMQCVDTGNNK